MPRRYLINVWHRRLVVSLISIPLMFGCKSSNHAAHSKTDLGPGNVVTARMFSNYKAKSHHCEYDEDADYRVILAGFGPFSGRAVNTSSLVAMNFIRARSAPAGDLVIPAIGEGDSYGVVTQGRVVIAGKVVAVCSVNAAVMWDLAGAIYLHEAGLFKPDLVIMSGMDGGSYYSGTWEHHAVNMAMPAPGYNQDGSPVDITPVVIPPARRADILPGGPDTLVMTWNAAELVLATNPIVEGKLPGFSIHTSDEETPGEYLCNNLSYVVLAGLSGSELSLAGGELKLRYPRLPHAKAGFFHYPWASPQDKGAVSVWGDVMAAAIQSEMLRSPR